MGTGPNNGMGKRQGNGFAVRPNYRSLAECSWRDIDSDIVCELVTTVTKAGAAVMFGVTSDGGALSLCILDNQNKIKEYPRSQTEVNDILLWLKDEYFPGGAAVPTPLKK